MAQRDIGNLRTRLSWEDEGANRSLEGFRRDLKGLRSEMRLAKSHGQDYTRSLKGMREQSDILTRRFKTQEERVKELRKRYKELADAGKEDTVQAKELASQINNATAEMNRTEEQLKNLNAEIRRQESPWTQLGEKMTTTGEKMQEFGRGMTTFGRDYSLKVTAPIVAGGTAMFKAAMDYESAFAGVRKTVDATEEEFATLSAGIREMAKELPAAATEIAGVAESAGQLGIANEHILGFTRVMIDLGVATDMSGEQAAMTLARLANITGMAQQDFDKLGSTLVDLGNNFAATEAEISEMALRIAGAGSQINMSEADILGFAAALSSVGIRAEAGGTAISKLMIEMASDVDQGGERLKEFARVAGMSVDDFRKAFEEDAATAIFTFLGGLGDLSEEGESAFQIIDELGLSEIRLRDTILRSSNAREMANDALKTANEAWKENTALTEEAEERYKTSESQLKMLWNRIKDVSITLGDALIPAVLSAIDAAEPLIQKIESGAQAFADMDEEQQRTILKMIALVAAIGPVSVGLGGMTTTVGGLLKVGGKLSTMLGKAGATGGAGLLGRFALMGPAAATPVGLAIAGLGLLGAGIYKQIERNRELTTVNLEAAESLTEQANALEDNIDKFEELQSKSKLSNEEMARLIDIFKEMQETSDEKVLEKLTEEYNKLLEKSGLTNEEMSEFLGINDELADKLDASNKKISEQGNALVDNVDALKDLNETQRERIRLELEAQAAAAEANRAELLKEQRDLQQEINELNEKIPETKQKIIDQEIYIGELVEDFRKASEEGNLIEQIYLGNKITSEAEILQQLRDQLKSQTDKLLKNHDDLEVTNEKLGKLGETYQKMIELELAQVGINAEKGKELEQIDKEIGKLQESKKELEEKKKKHGDNNGELQAGIEKIDEQISNLKTARSRVEDITSEAEKTNEELGKKIDKDVNVDDNGTAEKVHKEAEKPATKNVMLNALWSGAKRGLSLFLPGFAEGTDYHKGGPFIAGEEGFELGRLGNRWELLNFGMYDRPAGYEVFTHDESKRILRTLNKIPGYTTGASRTGEVDRVVSQLNDQQVPSTTIRVEQLVVREEADINKIAKQLHDLSRTKARSKGVIQHSYIG